MSSAFLKDLEHQAQSLDVDERARLAETLLESLQASLMDIESAWAKEIEDRVAAYDRGDLPSHAAEDVFAEARRLCR